MGALGLPAEWPEVENKAKEVEKVNPATIQKAADEFKEAGANADDHAAELKNAAAGLQDGVWDGPAADEFFAYVAKVGDAGKKFKDKLDEVATELEGLQKDLTEIKRKIETTRDDAKKKIDDKIAATDTAVAQAQQQAQNGQTPNPSPDAIIAAAKAENDTTASNAKTDIENLLAEADKKIAKSQELMKKEIEGGFSSVTPPGTASGGSSGHNGGGGGSSGGGGGSSSGGGGSSSGGGGGLGPSGGPPSSGPPPGNVDQWIREAIKILQANGIPVTEDNIDEIWTIIEKESGGDPHAINNWDSNAAKGTPSKGLMQCIDPTFQAHKLPGHDDIYNPVDNIIAGVRYTFDRYGGFEGHPGLKAMAGGGGYQGY
ncbi:transglycosylase SLT domain-containing protein [Amycolatopsis sp. 195334CR]|uniref:transglycosylase SLT domain-containing protein n=1 Tax=Amycolatopsis sp. 195334CR TaxID=2814588 RepID=UPI001A8FCEB0|nr:transglycosylase SLT domain-containing protein [Amycolatopsis sp. 195334CR]MBN6035858.1 transglycosylase SLT domain-containing protein [Amycolatopsis sp. 195334CR]